MNLPPFIMHNFRLKLVSLVMASLFWLYVVAGRDVETRVQATVKLINISESLKVLEKQPIQLEVDLVGSRPALLTVRPEDLQVTLDLGGVKEGVVSFTNLEKTIHVRGNIRITRVNPGKIELNLIKTGQ